MARYAMVMDTRRCIGCHSCTVACKVRNELPTDMVYNPVTSDGPHGTFPNLNIAVSAADLYALRQFALCRCLSDRSIDSARGRHCSC